MRRMLLLVTALGLSACDADQVSQTLVGEANKAAVTLKATKAPTPLASSEPAGSPDAIAVVTTKSVPEYYNDLEHCRAVAISKMGLPGAQDDLEALRRALQAHPGEKTVSLTYINDDRAIKRREMIKLCLTKSGYLVR